MENIKALASISVNLALALILSTLVGWLYVRYGRSLSDRRRFGRSFILLAIITTLVMSLIRSSLALSLGLVGALSIIRFRTPVKEPEELIYLFLVITIGLGMGADQPLLTITGFVFAAAVIRLQAIPRKKAGTISQVLSLASPRLTSDDIREMTDTLQRHCLQVTLRRFDEHEGDMEAIFMVTMDSFETFLRCKEALQKRFADIRVSLFDSGLLTAE